MRIERSGPAISELGVSEGNLRSLLLLPLAYVAWSSRRRDQRALEELLETSAAQAKLDADDCAAARGWLRNAPSPEQFRAGLALLRQLAGAADQPLLSTGDLLKSVLWASSAAQLDREPHSSGYAPVSSNARRAVRELEGWLNVDVGDLWADVLAELGEDLPRSRNVSAPLFQTLPDSSREPVSIPIDNQITPWNGFGLPRGSDAGAPASIPFPLVRRTAT